MTAEDAITFGPRPKLSQTMSSAEDGYGIGYLDFCTFISLHRAETAMDSDIMDCSGLEDALPIFKDPLR